MPGWNPDRQSRVARDAQPLGGGLLPLYAALGAGSGPQPSALFGAPLFGQAYFAEGEPVAQPAQAARSFDLPVTRRPAAIDNLTQADGSEFWLFGTPAVQPPGVQSTALPLARLRAAIDNLTEVDASEVWLFGTDALVSGVQSTDLPPRAAARARDYTFLESTPLGLLVPVGTQTASELPPRRASRATDYTWTQDLIPNLLGQDALVAGQQLSGNAPAGPRRASTLVDPGVNLTLIASQAPPVIPCGLGTGLTELSPRGPLRARDYTFAQPTPLQLIGKDQLFGAAGQVPTYDWSYQPPKPRYQQGSGEPIQDLLSTLLQVVTAAPPPGTQAFDLAPRGAARSRDYTWIWQLQLVLLGQDALPAGIQLSGNAPVGARRSVDYSFLASFPLELIGRDAMAAGRQWTELPFPNGPARARDYTLAAGFPLELFGRDAMLVGQQFTELAPRSAPRLRDYTHLATYALPNTTPQRDLVYVLGRPEHGWRFGQPVGAWTMNSPEHGWRTQPPQE